MDFQLPGLPDKDQDLNLSQLQQVETTVNDYIREGRLVSSEEVDRERLSDVALLRGACSVQLKRW